MKNLPVTTPLSSLIAKPSKGQRPYAIIQRCPKGFSLLEVAIVMLILSLVLGGVLISLATTKEIDDRRDSEAILNEVKLALYGFAQATGRLPCPATATSAGIEVPAGGGVCTQQHGFVPALTLGLNGAFNDDELLLDSWYSPLRYSVTSANTSAYTSSGGLSNAGINALAPDFRVCDAAACGNVIVDSVPAVLISLGADWASFDGADVDATENSGENTINGYKHANDTNFVSSQYIENNFDDLIVWVSSSILITKLIAVGQLP
jgi:prepilin-type N-terminal cleavage/methylation domain-containing protein